MSGFVEAPTKQIAGNEFVQPLDDVHGPALHAPHPAVAGPLVLRGLERAALIEIHEQPE